MKKKYLINKEKQYLEKYNTKVELDNWSRFTAILISLTALFWFILSRQV